MEGEHHRVPQEFIDELASFLGVSLVIRVAAGALSSSAAVTMMRARLVFDVSSAGRVDSCLRVSFFPLLGRRT